MIEIPQDTRKKVAAIIDEALDMARKTGGSMYAFGPESIVVQKVIEAAQLPIAAAQRMEITVIAKECGLSTAQVEDVIFEFRKRRNAAIQPLPIELKYDE